MLFVFVSIFNLEATVLHLLRCILPVFFRQCRNSINLTKYLSALCALCIFPVLILFLLHGVGLSLPARYIAKEKFQTFLFGYHHSLLCCRAPWTSWFGPVALSRLILLELLFPFNWGHLRAHMLLAGRSTFSFLGKAHLFRSGHLPWILSI